MLNGGCTKLHQETADLVTRLTPYNYFQVTSQTITKNVSPQTNALDNQKYH